MVVVEEGGLYLGLKWSKGFTFTPSSLNNNQNDRQPGPILLNKYRTLFLHTYDDFFFFFGFILSLNYLWVW